jgi:hypothetical protein
MFPKFQNVWENTTISAYSGYADASNLYIVYIGFGCKNDRMYITISFYRISLKFKYVSLLSG